MLITIDPYYDTAFYLECIQALRNNNVTYKEYINSKAPFDWVLELDREPIMVNYDEFPKNIQMYLVNKVEPATPGEEYLLQRKTALSGSKSFEFYCINEPLRQADKSDYACFFLLKNREQGIALSKKLGPIWYFGKYYNNIRVGLCLNSMIKNMIPLQEILIEKTKSSTQMELDLNFKVFRLNDRLRKFTETPKFENGSFIPVKIKQFNVNI